MIGIVVVSHSRALATAAAALASEMGGRQLPVIEVAAGLDDETFGTDAAKVADAVTAADSADGVLVLVDLGSAVLSAEMALELLAPDVAGHVRMTSAPLVEGLVAAVVTAAGGGSLEEAVAEARAGLSAKQEHIGDGGDGDGERRAGGSGSDPAASAGVERATFTVSVPHGLHARPAAAVVAVVRGFDAEVLLTDDDTGRGPVRADSLSRVATLDARQGHSVTATGTGPEAAAAVRALADLAERDFDEQRPTLTDEASSSPRSEPGAADVTTGSGLDVALGPAVLFAAEPAGEAYQPGDVATERERSEATRRQVIARLRDLAGTTRTSVGAEEAGIFVAQATLLDDDELCARVDEAIDAGDSALEGWTRVLDDLAASFETLTDEYQRARAQDVRQIRRAVAASLTGTDPDSGAPGGIVVVPELDAATAATVDAGRVAGVVTVRGGSTGHGVIVAKSRGIPVFTDAGESVTAAQPGTIIGFDAADRWLVVGPDERDERRLRALVRQRASERLAATEMADRPAVTGDGLRVRVAVNVGSLADARAGARFGADGCGLVRTEVLFGGYREAPGVDEQVRAYAAIAEALGGRPVTIRTWDIGGDKPVAFAATGPEANPFLGQRGLRLMRAHPALFRAQLAAACRVAVSAPVRLMFPMVTTADDVEWARTQLDDVAADVTGGLPDGLQVGIMVEVPAAAIGVAALANGLDFVSVGTNDLTQYTTAADRGNAAVAAYADAVDPAVVHLLDHVCRAVPHGVEVAVCGDLASDPGSARLLVALGVRELSVTAPSVPTVKAAIRSCTRDSLNRLADDARAAGSGAAVRSLLARN